MKNLILSKKFRRLLLDFIGIIIYLILFLYAGINFVIYKIDCSNFDVLLLVILNLTFFRRRWGLRRIKRRVKYVFNSNRGEEEEI